MELALGFGIPVLYFIISLMVTYVAYEQGRSQAGWFFIALFVTPVLALLFMIALGKKELTGKER